MLWLCNHCSASSRISRILVVRLRANQLFTWMPATVKVSRRSVGGLTASSVTAEILQAQDARLFPVQFFSKLCDSCRCRCCQMIAGAASSGWKMPNCSVIFSMCLSSASMAICTVALDMNWRVKSLLRLCPPQLLPMIPILPNGGGSRSGLSSGGRSAPHFGAT